MGSARGKVASYYSDCALFLCGSLIAFLTLWTLWSFLAPVDPTPSLATSATEPLNCAEGEGGAHAVNLNLSPTQDPPDPTFYDDPTLTYTVRTKPVTGWDGKREKWMEAHSGAGNNRVLVVTGSQPGPCRNPIGDHLLLRFFKNKVDYARLHGYDVFYNNVLLDQEMFSYWAKIPVVRAAMVAHPEVEWVYWVDSDAAFTDMEFKLPLERYKNHNLVVHGWPNVIYKNKSWTGLNAGVFLIRNCQWSLDLLEVWAEMGPGSPNYEKWGKVLRETLPDKLFPESDDQSGLIYLLLKERQKWGHKIYVEGEYYFEGYWLEIIETLDNVTNKYIEIEKKVPELRKRHAEKTSDEYAIIREAYLKDESYGKGGLRRPFITHFTGCQPCSGNHNSMYSGETCWDAMQKALNFADNQVLRNYGFVHPDLLDSSSVKPLPFDFPA